MNEKDKMSASNLVKERDALNVYFEALLQDAPVEAPADSAAPAVEAPVVAPVITLEPPVRKPEPVVEAVVAAESEVEQELGMPAWAEEEFQALLFRVAGLTLAVPLVELNGVQAIELEQITPMPGHVAWYLGLTQYRERSVPVIDTALLVLPEDRLAQLTAAPEERLGHIVYIGEGRWGLACDEVSDVISLSQDQVRWRSSRTKRRWLAGTVIDHMCALIDPPVFAEMLQTGINEKLPSKL